MRNATMLAILVLAPYAVFAADGFDLNSLTAAEVRASAPAVPAAPQPLPADDGDRKKPSGPAYAVFNPVGTSSVTVCSRTGLMWLTNPDDAGIGGTYDRAGALKVCEDLDYAGYSDWRLPKPGELTGIVNYNGPYAVNEGYFLSPRSKYWTSAPPILSAAYAWSLQFAVGSMYNIGSTGHNYVRCAR